MELNELNENFLAKKIEKKTFWRLVRERFLPLLEYQTALRQTSADLSLEITGEGVILNLGGVKFYFDFSQPFCRAESILAMQGDYEQQDFDLIKSMIHEGDIVFDVGGNVGLFSLQLAASCRMAEFYAFEPVPATYENMRRNLRLNDSLAARIKIFNVGFSDKEGEFVFYLPSANEAASMRPINDEFYLRESVEGIYTGNEKMTQVKCRVMRLDDFCCEKNIFPDILKMDVEGAELFVLKGATGMLGKQPVIYCEMLRKHAKRFDYHPNDIINFMSERDYSCFTFHKNKFSVVENIDDETTETNFFFLNRKKHADIIMRNTET